MYRIRWAEGAWALVVLFAAVLMACGLVAAFTFIVEPPTYPAGTGWCFSEPSGLPPPQCGPG